MNDLSKEAVECERRAVRCGAEAIATANPILRDLLFDIEDRWVALAESYRIAQQAMEVEDLRPAKRFFHGARSPSQL